MLDEPASALDPEELVGDVLDVLKQLAGEADHGVVVTHEMGLLEMSQTTLFSWMECYREENNPTISLVVLRKERTKQFWLVSYQTLAIV